MKMAYPVTELNLAVAFEKAALATSDYIAENGEHPFNCGFAWVVVKGARGKKAEMLKNYGFKKRYDGPGLSIWNPSKSFTQDMSAKMAGATVLADELSAMGFDAIAYQRLD
jgi:hypothetical protein